MTNPLDSKSNYGSEKEAARQAELEELEEAATRKIFETMDKKDRYFALPWWRRIFTDWRKL